MINDTSDEASTADTPIAEGRSMTASRVIEASPERVYDAFLNPNELAVWLPPTGFTAEVHELEPEIGGTFRISFTAEDDELEPYARTFYGTYQELKSGERIVYTEEFETEDPDMAGEMMVTVTLMEISDGTEVTVRQDGIPEAIPPSDANAGWNDSLENLAGIVEGDR